MAEATLTLNGKIYRLACGEGEEARLQQLSRIVSEKLDKLLREFGQVGEDRLLLMSALLIADDMLDARENVERLEKRLAELSSRKRESAD